MEKEIKIAIAVFVITFFVGWQINAVYNIFPPAISPPTQYNIPTFLNRAPDNHYLVTYVDGGCLSQISLSQGDGGIWYRDGSGGCFVSADNQSVTNPVALSCVIKEIGLGGSIFDKVFFYTCGDSNWLAIVHENGTVTWSKAP